MDTCKLSIRLLNGENVRREFHKAQTLNDVRLCLDEVEKGKYVFSTTFPKRRFASVEEGISLEEAGLCPSGTIILQALDVSPTPQSYLSSWYTWIASFFTYSDTAPPQYPAPPSQPATHSSTHQRFPDRKDESRNNGNGTAFEY